MAFSASQGKEIPYTGYRPDSLVATLYFIRLAEHGIDTVDQLGKPEIRELLGIC